MGKRGVKKRIFFIFKILFSIILGFLPSFLFIALFVQYGSLFSNYLKFLLNFNSSFWAWVSALAISLFAQFIFWFVRKNNFRKIIKNKLVLAILALSFLIIFSLVALQLYLYLNFTLRNDILVRLSADKDNLFFTDNLKDEVNFKISVTMNPFCSADCRFSFFDITRGEVIDSGQFNISSIFSKTKGYTFDNLNLVQGSQILNRFEVSCKSKRTLLCYTSEQENSRAVLITINYDLNDEDKLFKNTSREQISSLLEMLYLSNGKLNESMTNIQSINNSFSAEYFIQNLKSMDNLSEINSSLNSVIDLWKKQKFNSLRTELPSIWDRILSLSSEYRNLSLDIISNISTYNNLIDELINSRKMLDELSQKNLDVSQCTNLNVIVSNFNEAIIQFREELNLSNKITLVENISYAIRKFYNESGNVAGVSEACLLTEPISEVNFIKIPITEIVNEIPAPLDEPNPVCCYYGKCEKCCDKTCSSINYPVIFLHGQSINKALPADYSFDTFLKIKEKLILESYIDAGSVVLSQAGEKEGLWGEINVSMIMTASYFFDTYKTSAGEKTVSSNTDSIDTYAIRLKSIVDLVKYRTNKDKAILVAHSMGGVVARRYIQIFGGKDVEKLILITVPNHGVDDKVRDYCAVIGPEASCNDLSEDSILMNKLNNAPTDIVPTYNIVGIGCDMGDDTGDGIIKNSSQYLDYATNYYFNGTCNELSFGYFHEFIIDSDKYPEVYTMIRELLKK